MEQKYIYKTSGTCSSAIILTVDRDILTAVQYMGGCSGNTQGIAKLVAGMPIDAVIERLSGIRCGFKATSCPDQLANALTLLKNGEIGGKLKKA